MVGVELPHLDIPTRTGVKLFNLMALSLHIFIKLGEALNHCDFR